jgi:hypothetical protein
MRATRRQFNADDENIKDAALYHHPFSIQPGWTVEDLTEAGKKLRNLSKYTTLPNKVIRNVMPDLSGVDYKVLSVLFYWQFHPAMRDPKTGIWTTAFPMSGRALSKEAGAHINACMMSVRVLVKLGFITVTGGKGKTNLYSINLDQLKQYVKGTYKRKENEDEESSAGSASVKMRGSSKAAKRVSVEPVGPQLVETPQAEPVTETIALGESLEVEVYGILDIVNDITPELTVTLRKKEDGTGVFATLSNPPKGEDKAIITQAYSSVLDSEHRSYPQKTSTVNVEVSGLLVVQSEAAITPQLNADEESEFKAYQGEIKANQDDNEYALGIGRAQFIHAQSRPSRVWLVAMPDGASADFLSTRQMRRSVPRDVEIRYTWPVEEQSPAPPVTPTSTFHTRLCKAIPLQRFRDPITKEFLAYFDAICAPLPADELVDFIGEQLKAPRFAKGGNSLGMVYTLANDFRKVKLQQVAGFLGQYA